MSSDIKVNGALRDQPACSMLGEAAGVAACSHSDRSTGIRFGYEAVGLLLRKGGSKFPQTELTKQMTPSECLTA